jgi:regulator of sigma E protease
MDIIIMTAQLLLGLSILVGVHEAGHMLAAKYFGMRVEKYSIGFPPKVFGFTKGETEYSIGAIPLGGFVKISGMIDESLDTKNLNKDPEPWEFRAKPAWQRLIVMMGGIIVNILTGILILILVTFIYGEKYFSREEVNKRGIVAYELGKRIGLQTGDKITEINGKPYKSFNEVLGADVLLSDSSTYTVKRGDQNLIIRIPGNLIGDLSKKDEEFIFPIFPFKVGKITSGSAADIGGLKDGDKILALNNKSIEYFHEFQENLKTLKSKQVTLKVKRGDQIVDLKVNVDSTGKIGFRPINTLPTSVEHYTFLQSIPKGTKQAFDVIANTIKGFNLIFRGKVSARDSISGPIGIAQEFGGNWDWQRFWSLVGFLSMVLAFMNFLPIPALDGGHVIFLCYEMIARRKPSDKFMEIAQKIGMVILLALMVFAFGNDIFKIISKWLG